MNSNATIIKKYNSSEKRKWGGNIIKLAMISITIDKHHEIDEQK